MIVMEFLSVPQMSLAIHYVAEIRHKHNFVKEKLEKKKRKK